LNRKCIVEITCARVQRNSVLDENTNGFDPPVRQSSHVDEHGLHRKTFTECFVFQQVEFLCVGYKKSPPNRLIKVDKERSLFKSKTMN
jgi:hypothetical protein